MNAIRRPCAAPRRRQQGVALAVALILLLVVTLIGLASMRGTALQERMSANMYDRSLAFQRAESALRAAESAITGNWQAADLGAADCSGNTQCQNASTTAFGGSDDNWIDVEAERDVNGAMAPGTPQYHIQFMGTGIGPNNLGLAANADYGNYGNNYPPDNIAYYRITARSADPDATGDRSIVVLQSTAKRAF